jgi:hypothetical protein
MAPRSPSAARGLVAAALACAAVAQPTVTTIGVGTGAVTGVLSQGQYAYYSFALNSSASVVVDLRVDSYGDPDLAVSLTPPPLGGGALTGIFASSSATGSDTVTLSSATATTWPPTFPAVSVGGGGWRGGGEGGTEGGGGGGEGWGQGEGRRRGHRAPSAAATCHAGRVSGWHAHACADVLHLRVWGHGHAVLAAGETRQGGRGQRGGGGGYRCLVRLPSTPLPTAWSHPPWQATMAGVSPTSTPSASATPTVGAVPSLSPLPYAATVMTVNGSYTGGVSLSNRRVFYRFHPTAYGVYRFDVRLGGAEGRGGRRGQERKGSGGRMLGRDGWARCARPP